MSTATLRIKRRGSGNAGAPASMANAELAFNEVDDTLYYGKGTGGAGGTATTALAIGGPGAFVNLSGTQTVSGNKTFSGTVNFTGTVTGVGGGGTVTSVTGTSPVSVATGTSTPVISLASGYGDTQNPFASKTANFVLAAPNGSAGVPTFRALVTADVSGFDTQVRTNRLDQMAAPTAAVVFNSQRITGLADPQGAQDAATRAYVDATAQGLDVKQSVRVATTANITLSATQTIDGVSVIAGDRVLVKNQTTGSQNGIYVVAAGAWSRATDANDATKLTAGAFTFVEEGTANADSGWVLTTNSPITIDTTALAFTQFSGAGQITAGTGLTKTGNTLAISTVPVVNGGTNLTTVPQGSVLVANTSDTLTALDGSGTSGFLAYNGTTDTISWATVIDGGTY